jgi:predicted GIY-YIG superfamily endonuclease
MYFVYIIRSLTHPNQIYVGYTSDLKKRLARHNCGSTHHTNKYKPWELVVFVYFKKKEKAIAFEQYLKSGSGRVFRDKRFL